MRKETIRRGKKSEKQAAKRRQSLSAAGKVDSRRGKAGTSQPVKKTTAPKVKSRSRSAQVRQSGLLSQSHGLTELVLFPLDPFLVHVYSEIAPPECEQAILLCGEDPALLQPVLRFYDITGILFDGRNVNSLLDVAIEIQTQNWYVSLWSPGRSYFTELGFKSSGGAFYPVARSNVAQIPPALTAEEHEVRYMRVEGNYKVIERFPGFGESGLWFDLTETNEKAFTSGVSSELVLAIMEREQPLAG